MDEELKADPAEPETDASASPPLTDSPWFWLYIFCTFGLIALLLTLPKLEQRQLELQREGVAKREAWKPANEQTSGARSRELTSRESSPNDPETKIATRQQTIATARLRIRSIIAVLSALLLVAWCVFLWGRVRSRESGVGSHEL